MRRPPNEARARALIVQHVADHHLRTLRYQQAGLRGTLAAPPAAHEHHLVVEARHVRSPDNQTPVDLPDIRQYSKSFADGTPDIPDTHVTPVLVKHFNTG